MELSKGFNELEKQFFKHYAAPYSLIPLKGIISKLVFNNPLKIIPLEIEEKKETSIFTK